MASGRPDRDRPARARPALPQPSGREGGHAFYAAQARRALGISPEHLVPRLPDIPAPVFQGAVALAASALCILARPQLVGQTAGVALDAVLVAITCAAILYHARLVLPEGARPGIEVCVLPAAALVSNAVVLAGTASVAVMPVAVVATAVVAALVPHLDALRLRRSESTWVRVGLDLAGIVAMVPLALAGAGSLPEVSRMLLAGAGGGAVCYDALRADRPRSPVAIAGAVVTAAALAAGALRATTATSQAYGAAGLLLLWYGLRGVGVSLLRRPVQRSALAEYAAVAIAAALLIVGSGR